MNKLLTLSTPVPAAIEPRVVKQKFSHGRTRTVIVENVRLDERTHIDVQVVPKQTAVAVVDKKNRPPLSAKKSKKNRLQRRLEALEEAKRERTRKAIEKLRVRRGKQGRRTAPASGEGRPRKKSDRWRAREEALKDRVAHLARLIRQHGAPELYDRNKAKSEVDWIYGLRTSSWPSNDRVRLEFVLEVLNSIVAGRRPTYIETPDGGYFRWPSTEAGVPSRRQTMEEPKHEIGVLTEMGYRVGANGVGTIERRALLSKVYRDELRLDLSAEYLAEWGKPETPLRLRKLANTIANLTKNIKRRQLTGTSSIDEWEADLEFLRQAFYVGRYDFKWPTS